MAVFAFYSFEIKPLVREGLTFWDAVSEIRARHNETHLTDGWKT
jgi:hypothetical protein